MRRKSRRAEVRRVRKGRRPVVKRAVLKRAAARRPVIRMNAARRVALNALAGVPAIAAAYIISQIGLTFALPRVYSAVNLQLVLPPTNLIGAIMAIVFLGLGFGAGYAIIERIGNLRISYRNIFSFAVVLWAILLYLPLLLTKNLGSVFAVPVITQVVIDIIGLLVFTVLFYAIKDKANI